MNATFTRMQYESVRELLPAIEKIINTVKDRKVRNRLILHLMMLDQLDASLRDKLDLPGLMV